MYFMVFCNVKIKAKSFAEASEIIEAQGFKIESIHAASESDGIPVGFTAVSDEEIPN